MRKKWPQGYLTDREWPELLGIEYTLTMYPTYYSEAEYSQAVSRLQELRDLKHLDPRTPQRP